ncbi:uncharacterized protein LOC128391812 [Panonychus citri]|uniref:uncharacterized protein LOC128391812 n=1 Tax=Panonychus citri TaxID=50023 RepID=UPI00230751EF|nr:uncharacterized protein LOC128391812 [Panonychus citri]
MTTVTDSPVKRKPVQDTQIKDPTVDNMYKKIFAMLSETILKREIVEESDSETPTQNEGQVKDLILTNYFPTHKADNDDLAIPRTQRINKAGDPVGEKCTCHHHQVVVTK